MDFITDKEWKQIQIDELKEQIEALENGCSVKELRERKFNKQCADAFIRGDIGWILGAKMMREWEFNE